MSKRKSTPITLVSKFFHKGALVHEHTETLDFPSVIERDVDYELTIADGKTRLWWCVVEKTLYDPKTATITLELRVKQPFHKDPSYPC